MKFILKFILLFSFQIGYAQVELNADGAGDTYGLIASVLAPGQNPIEVPDCGHNAFGDHIDQVFDEELNAHVFRFHIHTEPDNDRCISFDRQRNEIKSYAPSPDNLLGVQDEKVIYNWKFKLAEGFQTSPNFTHLHQLKSVGGPLASSPMYTLTARKSNPDRLELRYAETDNQTTLKQSPLAPFINTWLEVTETIVYGTSGTYEIEIKRVSDEVVLFEYENNSIINWRPEAEFVRPKWGIYRSLINAQDLRDEMVFFANFSIEEVDFTTSTDATLENDIEIIFSNPIINTIYVNDVSSKVSSVRIFSLEGKKVMDKIIEPATTFNLDVSYLPKGTYVLNFLGKGLNQAEMILVN